MIVGTIGYDVHSGLGHLVRDFWKNGIVNRVLVVPHKSYKRYPNWYPDGVGFSLHRAQHFLKGLDVLLLFENGFHWNIVKMAKERGIKIVLIPMYEYTPFPVPVRPDLVITPSDLDQEIYQKHYDCHRLSIPVSNPWRKRERAFEFVHNAGHGQHTFAKGTPELVQAMEYVQSPVKLLVRGQPGERRITDLFLKNAKNPKVELQYGDLPDDEMFSRGDVYINAEQFNGLSLPLQEAYASGMMVVTTDRFPANTWLPREPLIPVARYEKYKIAIEFDRAFVDPKDIAKRIDEWYGQDISCFSLSGKLWAEENSWEKLGPQYLSILGALL